MRLLPTPFLLVLALFTTLVVAPAVCGSHGSDLPGSRETVIDEPIFGGKAWIFEAGREHARSVVLVHGLGDDASRSWDSVIPELARDYHVLVFDLPGFGRSTRANEWYTPKAYAEFVEFVTARFVPGRFALVGHSMGGAIALRYAATHPERVERLVLVDAAGVLHRVVYSSALAQLGIENLPGTYPGQGRLSRWIDDLFSRYAGVSEVTIPAEGLILSNPAMRQRFFQGDPNKIAGYALLLEDFSRQLSRVEAPTLVVWGAKDGITPIRTGKLLASNIAGARFVVIPGARHTPMKSQPGRFRRVLGDYLAIPPDALANGQIPGAPYALDPSVAWRSDRVGRCEGRRRRQRFEGEYDRIVIDDCKEVVLSAVRAREIEVIDSRVEIENSVIRGDGVALRLNGSRVTVTGGRIEGRVAVSVEETRLDIAGTLLIGERVAVEVRGGSDPESEARILFSVCRVESPETSAYVHGPRTVAPRTPM